MIKNFAPVDAKHAWVPIKFVISRYVSYESGQFSSKRRVLKLSCYQRDVPMVTINVLDKRMSKQTIGYSWFEAGIYLKYYSLRNDTCLKYRKIKDEKLFWYWNYLIKRMYENIRCEFLLLLLHFPYWFKIIKKQLKACIFNHIIRERK